MGFGLEVEMVALARRKDLLTTPYVFSGKSMLSLWPRVGADIIVCHLGLTTGGSDRRGNRAQARRLPCYCRSLRRGSALGEFRDHYNPCVHGGPVAEPADADFIMKNTRHCHGFYGASSMERLPVEAAIRDQTRAFKKISRKGGTNQTPAGTTRRQAPSGSAGRWTGEA